MKRAALVISMIIFATVSVLSSPDNFYTEKDVLIKGTDVMNKFAENMEKADETDEIITVSSVFFNDFKPVIKEIEKIAKVHPDWNEAPPEELMPQFDKYVDAGLSMCRGFSKLYKRSMAEPENRKLNDIFLKLKHLLYPGEE